MNLKFNNSFVIQSSTDNEVNEIFQIVSEILVQTKLKDLDLYVMLIASKTT